MSTFIVRLDTSGSGVRLAVKDLFDMKGIPTTAGCAAVADEAKPAEEDAACLAGARAAKARIVGRTNLHELAFGVTGVNPWFGTPRNPLDDSLVPGGSSSGSAVAVATGEADVAYGSDTGGSVRIPSACCGTTGLKTTFGRIPLRGVWPLAPSFDTVGPMARDVAGVESGMAMLEPGFEAAPPRELRVGRIRVEADPLIDGAITDALEETGWEVDDVDLPQWDEASVACGVLLLAESWTTNHALLERKPERIGSDTSARLRWAGTMDSLAVGDAKAGRERWMNTVAELFGAFDVLATPTLTIFPPKLDDGDDLLMARCTLPVNLAGLPALSLPVAVRGHVPASLQLIAPARGEELLVSAARHVERAVATW